MNSKEYIQAMVSSNELIYIDTAALMDTESMELFISNCREILIMHGRRIIVPKAVCLELARHLGSKNTKKVESAMKALGLLSNNEELFEVCNEAMSEEEIAKAFADSQLLAELTLHKSEHGQLLITNDKKLSKDAYSLNNQESCRGFRIMVCYINRGGELYMCDCVREEKRDHEQVLNLVMNATSDTEQTKDVADSYVANESARKSETNEDNNEKEKSEIVGLGTIGLAFGTFVAGVFLERNKVAITRLVTGLI